MATQQNKHPYITTNNNNIQYLPPPNISNLPSIPSIPSIPSLQTLSSYPNHCNQLQPIPTLPPPNYYHANHQIVSLPHIPSLPSMQSLQTMKSIPSIPSFSSIQSLQSMHSSNSSIKRSETIRSNLSDFGHDEKSQNNDNFLLNNPLPITPLIGTPKRSNTSTPKQQHIITPFQFDSNAFTNEQLLGFIDMATAQTMKITDDLASNATKIQNENMKKLAATEKKEQSKEEETNNKNPWFNDEIAEIVKLHRKTIRKYHRSKTKKKRIKGCL